MSKESIREKEKEKQMTTETLARSPAGPIEPVKDLKRRKQRVWWRPHTDPEGNVSWVQTRPLPDDLGSREQYLAKGFRMTPPKDKEAPAESTPDSEKDALYAEIAQLREKVAELQPKKKAKRA